jgi:hypothetical protein
MPLTTTHEKKLQTHKQKIGNRYEIALFGTKIAKLLPKTSIL